MSLITTIGSKNANSFNTVAEADAYLADIGIYDLTAWNALTTGAKEIRLIHGALILKNEFVWDGWPVYKNQFLPFPLWFATDDPIVVPEAIKQAHAYISYAIVHKRFVEISNPADGPSTAPDITSLGLLGISIGAASTPAQPVDSSVLEMITQTEHMHIYNLLKPYLAGAVYITGRQKMPIQLDEVA